MLYPRIIPCLLIKDKGLVKTVKFQNPKYVGDPLNAVKIFNEKEVDELIVLDIDASTKQLEPDYQAIRNMAVECRMPLCYGGGIKTIEQAQKIFNLGVEKIAISSAGIKNPQIVSNLAVRVGSQSVVIVLDVKKKLFKNEYEVFINNAQKNTGKCPVELSKHLEKLGAGEIVINSIDNDGLMQGYDFNLVENIRRAVRLPITVLGGASSLGDVKKLIDKFGIIGAAAGSLFVFKGKYRAVLINYPNRDEKEELIQ
jgi:cyclase